MNTFWVVYLAVTPMAVLLLVAVGLLEAVYEATTSRSERALALLVLAVAAPFACVATMIVLSVRQLKRASPAK